MRVLGEILSRTGSMYFKKRLIWNAFFNSRRGYSEKELILHIGSDKAGSTAIQTHCYMNRDWLLLQRVYLPSSFLAEIRGHSDLFRNLSFEKLWRVRKELDSTPAAVTRILLTWEGIHFLDEKDLAMLELAFKGYAVRVVYYVREQAELLQSGLLQEVKTGNRRVRFDKESQFQTLPWKRDFYNTIKRWESVFSNIEFDVVLFNRAEFVDGNILNDFFMRIGCVRNDYVSTSLPMNPSLDYSRARLILMIEAIFLGEGSKWQNVERRNFVDLLLLDILNEGKKFPYFLEKTDVDRIRHHFKESNRKLVEEYHVSNRLIEAKKEVWIEADELEEISRESSLCLERIEPYINVPCVWNKHTIEENRLKEFLNESWYVEEQSDVFWCRGNQSRISFRLFFQNIKPNYRHINISLTGRYINPDYESSQLSINEIEFESHNLSNHVLTVPMSELRYPYLVEIILKHNELFKPSEIEPNSTDHRELSYGLSSIAIETY